MLQPPLLMACFFFFFSHSPASAIMSVVFLKETVRASDIFGKHPFDRRSRCVNVMAAAGGTSLQQMSVYCFIMENRCVPWWFAQAPTNNNGRRAASTGQSIRSVCPASLLSSTPLPPPAKADAACSG